MQLLHVLLMSLIFPVASLTSADTTTFDSVDWSNVDDSADLGISEPDMFDNHEANPSLNLFSDVDPDGPAWDSSTSLDGSSSPIEFSTDTAVDDSAAACLSSSFQNSLSTNDLQTRSPIQCPNNLDNSDPGSTTTTPTTPTDNLDDQIMKTFERKFSVPGVWPNARLCPFERYGLRSLALCDSGLHDDVIQDDDNWVINLKNPSPYVSGCPGSIETGWCCVFYNYQFQKISPTSIRTERTGEDCWPFDLTPFEGAGLLEYFQRYQPP